MIDDQPTLFECKLWGASAALISKPHSTDGGVPLWRMNMMAKSGMFPNLAHAMENMVGRVYMHTKQLKIPITVMSLLCSDFPAQRSEEWYAAHRDRLNRAQPLSVFTQTLVPVGNARHGHGTRVASMSTLTPHHQGSKANTNLFRKVGELTCFR